MLTTKEAIEKRRSIRKYKQDGIPDEIISQLIEAAGLAPSGCNAQPWRFKIVRDAETKFKLAEAAFKQKFIAEAPVVIICCADVKGYIEGTVSGVQDLGRIGVVEDRVVKILLDRVEEMKTMNIEQLGARISLNVAIAVEHIVLRALDFGLGTCWIRLFDEKKVKSLLDLDENVYVVSLLPLGYPDEEPPAKKRLGLEDILLS
ncbi:MAG: nitroreductase family protein [Bacillota bacterium]